MTKSVWENPRKRIYIPGENRPVEWDIDDNRPVYTKDLIRLARGWTPDGERTLGEIIERFSEDLGKPEDPTDNSEAIHNTWGDGFENWKQRRDQVERPSVSDAIDGADILPWIKKEIAKAFVEAERELGEKRDRADESWSLNSDDIASATKAPPDTRADMFIRWCTAVFGWTISENKRKDIRRWFESTENMARWDLEARTFVAIGEDGKDRKEATDGTDIIGFMQSELPRLVADELDRRDLERRKARVATQHIIVPPSSDYGISYVPHERTWRWFGWFRRGD